MSSTLRSIGIETAKTLYDTIRGRDSNFLFFLGGAETVTENKNTIDEIFEKKKHENDRRTVT